MEKNRIGPLVTVLLILLIIWVGFVVVGSLAGIILNSLIGLGILLLINLIPSVKVRISIWSVLIVGLGGIPGIILVLLLNYEGIEL